MPDKELELGGVVLDDDQSDVALPELADWQTEYYANMREGWERGFYDASDPNVTVQDNAYLKAGSSSDSLLVQTLALGWEDGFLVFRAEGSFDDCPYPSV